MDDTNYYKRNRNDDDGEEEDGAEGGAEAEGIGHEREPAHQRPRR